MLVPAVCVGVAKSTVACRSARPRITPVSKCRLLENILLRRSRDRARQAWLTPVQDLAPDDENLIKAVDASLAKRQGPEATSEVSCPNLVWQPTECCSGDSPEALGDRVVPSLNLVTLFDQEAVLTGQLEKHNFGVLPVEKERLRSQAAGESIPCAVELASGRRQLRKLLNQPSVVSWQLRHM